MKKFIIPDFMTYDYLHRERSGWVELLKRIFEKRKIRVDGYMNKHNRRNPTKRVVEKRVAEIDAYFVKLAKIVDVAFATGNDTNPFLRIYTTYGKNGIDSLVGLGVGTIHMNKRSCYSRSVCWKCYGQNM